MSAEAEGHENINEAIRAGFGVRVGGHAPDEVSAGLNDYIRIVAGRGTSEEEPVREHDDG
jgi:hypothetical protein